MRVRSVPVFSPRKCTSGKRCSSSAFCGPLPTTTLEPGRSSDRNASRFFSTATRPTVRKIGLGRSSLAGASGLNSLVSTPRVQKPSRLKPRRVQLLLQRVGGDHGHRRRIMKAAHHPIADRVGNAGADRDILGEARGVGGGECEPVAQAIAPHRPADGAFGRDVDRVGRGLFDPPCDLAPVRNRKPQARIGRHLKRRKSLRRQEGDLGAEAPRPRAPARSACERRRSPAGARHRSR